MPLKLFGGYTPFDNLYSSANQHLEGTFQIEGSASGLSYKKAIIATLPLQTTTLTDNWKVQILENEKPGAKVLFEHEVQFKIYVQATEDAGVPIFIARPADDEQLVIKTTIINGETIAAGTGKDHLDLGYGSEFVLTNDFTASPGVGGGVITGEVQTLPYVQSVYEGNVFRILQDGFRPIGLSKIATYEVSYKPAASESAALFDDAGAIRVAAPSLGRIEVRHSYGNAPFVRRALLSGLREPSLWKDPTNRMWLAAIESGNYKLFSSQNDGRSWKRSQATNPEKPAQQIDVIIFDSSFKYPRAIRLESGDIAALALKGGTVYFKRAPPGSIFMATPIPVAKAQKNEPYTLMEDLRNGLLRATNAHGHVLVSSSGGRSWTEEMPGTS